MSSDLDAAAPTPAPVCPEHPERPSRALCERCGRFLCEACAVSREPALCASCHARVSDPLGVRAQPFTVGGALSNGWKLFRSALPGLLAVALIFGALGGLYFWFTLSEADSLGATLRKEFLFNGFVGTFGVGATLAMLVGAAEGRRLGLVEALRESVRAWPRLFGARLCSGLVILLMCLLLIVPGIIKGISFALAEEAAYREPGKDALDNATELTTGSRWELLGMLLVCYGILLMVVAPVGAMGGYLSEFYPSVTLPCEIVVDVLTRVTTAFISAVALAAFYGLKKLRGQQLAPR